MTKDNDLFKYTAGKRKRTAEARALEAGSYMGHRPGEMERLQSGDDGTGSTRTRRFKRIHNGIDDVEPGFIAQKAVPGQRQIEDQRAAPVEVENADSEYHLRCLSRHCPYCGHLNVDQDVRNACRNRQEQDAKNNKAFWSPGLDVSRSTGHGVRMKTVSVPERQIEDSSSLTGESPLSANFQQVVAVVEKGSLTLGPRRPERSLADDLPTPSPEWDDLQSTPTSRRLLLGRHEIGGPSTPLLRGTLEDLDDDRHSEEVTHSTPIMGGTPAPENLENVIAVTGQNVDAEWKHLR
jgi:hypothetical protein